MLCKLRTVNENWKWDRTKTSSNTLKKRSSWWEIQIKNKPSSGAQTTWIWMRWVEKLIYLYMHHVTWESVLCWPVQMRGIDEVLQHLPPPFSHMHMVHTINASPINAWLFLGLNSVEAENLWIQCKLTGTAPQWVQELRTPFTIFTNAPKGYLPLYIGESLWLYLSKCIFWLDCMFLLCDHKSQVAGCNYSKSFWHFYLLRKCQSKELRKHVPQEEILSMCFRE